MASTDPEPPDFDENNFQYLFPAWKYPVLDLAINDPSLGLPTRIVTLLMGDWIGNVRELITRRPQDLTSIDLFGDKYLEIVQAMLAGYGLHLAVYDASFTPPSDNRWVHLIVHPVLESEVGEYPISWLSRGPEDDPYLSVITEGRLVYWIGQLLEMSEEDFNWRFPTPDGSSLLEVEASLAWTRALLNFHGLSFR